MSDISKLKKLRAWVDENLVFEKWDQANVVLDTIRNCIYKGNFYIEELAKMMCIESPVLEIDYETYGWSYLYNAVDVFPDSNLNYHLIGLSNSLRDLTPGSWVDDLKLNAQTEEVSRQKDDNSGEIECIDVIEAALSCHQNPFGAWLTGQIIKYVWHWPLKNGLEDLKKAKFYLDQLIKMEEKDDS